MATKKRSVKKKVAFKNSHRIEEVAPTELTLERIREVHHAFEVSFDLHGGYKGYEAQALGMLLALLDRIQEIMECNDPGNARELFGPPKE